MTKSDDPEIDALVARGAYVEAARLATSRGKPARAITLYERVWRFADAVPLALALGDRPLAIRLCLDGGDAARASEIAAGIPGESAAELRAAAEVFAMRGRAFEAAGLAERAGQLGRSAELYQRAGALLEAARVLDLQGELHGAGVLYERVAFGSEAPDDPETGRARLALGRLLGRLGRHHDAARALQAAARDPALKVNARRALCAELLAMGLREAALEVARLVFRQAPDLPQTPEEIASLERSHDQRPGGGGLMRQRFLVSRLLGSGTTGRVYVADDTLVGRQVAVKLLSVGAGAVGPERQAYLRFAREAEAAGRLRHPNIVTLHDFDESAGMLVLEFMSGGTLLDALGRDGPLTPATVRRLALDVLAGLDAAHQRHIVHRDIKPANLFFDAARNAKVGDFGAAHLQDFGQTQTGGFMGTIAYMPPEQISGAPIGAAADLYALGATLFEALTGRRPFLGPDVVAQHLGETPPAPSSVRPGLRPEHDEVLQRALMKAPGDRYESAAAMAAAIRRWPARSDTEFSPHRAPPLLVGGDLEPGGAPGTSAEDREIARTDAGRLVVRYDARVGRPVLVEERNEPLDDEARAALRRLAAAGGPHVQRVLGISADGRAVTYEDLPGPVVGLDALPANEREIAAEAATALPASGNGRAPADVRIAQTPGGPVVLIYPLPRVLEPGFQSTGQRSPV